MAAVTICSDFGAPQNKVCHCFHCFSIYLPWNDGTRCHDLCFLNVELIWFRSYLNGLVVFPTFFNLSLNLAIRSSWSEPQSAPSLVFGQLYRASPSLAAKNIINLILVWTIWWCPCVESSLVLLEEGVCYDQCVLLAKLYKPLPCFILYSKAKFACCSRCFLTGVYAT